MRRLTYVFSKIRSRLISSFSSPTPVVNALENAVSSGHMLSDTGAQKDAAIALDLAFGRISRFALKRRAFTSTTVTNQQKEKQVETLTSQTSTLNPSISLLDPPADVLAQGNVPKGLFLYGGVGTGKSLLMDTLFSTVSDINKNALERGELEPIPARRVHFHAFMLEVHSRVHAIKQKQLSTFGRNRNIDIRPERDAIMLVAKDIANEAWLLCFDEFQVTDIADAMILKRLFDTLISHGVMIIATSNRPPEDLYKDGLNRDLFLPFVDLLKTHCKVHELISPIDYRYKTTFHTSSRIHGISLNKSSDRGNATTGYGISGGISLSTPSSSETLIKVNKDNFFYPLDKTSTRIALYNALIDHGLANIHQQNAISIDSLSSILESLPRTKVQLMMNRELSIRTVSSTVAIASFTELCSRPVGAADYKGLCSNFKTIFLLDVPRLSPLLHNDARRLITLVDMFYEYRTQLFVTAASPLDRLFDPLLRLQRTGARDLTTILTIPLEPGTKFNDISTSKEEGEQIETAVTTDKDDAYTDDTSSYQVEVEEGESDGRLTRQLPIADGSCRFEVSSNTIKENQSTNAAAVVSVVTSAAERAALGELTFACRRAQSRLFELTKVF